MPPALKERLPSPLVRLARKVSPRRRRWRRFLRSLPLDPDALDRPLEEPSPTDFIICGAPRTGTTLLSAVLHQPPEIITAMEPWDGLRLPPAELFASLRSELDRTGRLERGKLDLPALEDRGVVQWSREGATSSYLNLDPGYLLGVKWPAFWRYLPLLPKTKFLVCLRDPVAVLGSFRRVGGTLERGLEYDTRFNDRMNRTLEAATSNPSVRRVLFYDYVYSRILPHLDRPNVQVVRFERWFSEPAEVLAEVGDFLGTRLDRLPVEIVSPRHDTAATSEDLRWIDELCTTRRLLGYGPATDSAATGNPEANGR